MRTRPLDVSRGRSIEVVAAAGLAVTALVASSPPLRFAYRAPELHVALEATAVVIGLFAAAFIGARYRRSRTSVDFALALGLSVLVCSNLAFSAVPSAVGAAPGGTLTMSGAIIGRLVATAILASAVILPARPVELAGRRWRLSAAVCLVLAVVVAAAAAAGGHLAATFEAPHRSSWPLFEDGAVSVIQLLGFGLQVVAAVGLARRSRRLGDPFFGWLALALVLGSCASLNYFLYPSLYSEWIYTGDGFRFLAYCAYLTASLGEIRRYSDAVAQAAVMEERRRIARDLHDTVAQELAFIGRRASRMPEAAAAEAEAIRAASHRALAESRRTIEALSRSPGQDFGKALDDALRIAATRSSIAVSVDVDPTFTLDADVREALVLIASEAVTNASRHSEAEHVLVETSDGPPRMLRIVDDGRGFDVGRQRNGYGLRIMRERAEAIGAAFRLRTLPDSGTEIEVALP